VLLAIIRMIRVATQEQEQQLGLLKDPLPQNTTKSQYEKSLTDDRITSDKSDKSTVGCLRSKPTTRARQET
jgi:hypothetical protein